MANDLNNVGCAQGSSAVQEFVQSDVQFVPREQTVIHVQGTEATIGIATLDVAAASQQQSS